MEPITLVIQEETFKNLIKILKLNSREKKTRLYYLMDKDVNPQVLDFHKEQLKILKAKIENIENMVSLLNTLAQ